jgi:hypothetical protein
VSVAVYTPPTALAGTALAVLALGLLAVIVGRRRGRNDQAGA